MGVWSKVSRKGVKHGPARRKNHEISTPARAEPVVDRPLVRATMTFFHGAGRVSGALQIANEAGGASGRCSQRQLHEASRVVPVTFVARLVTRFARWVVGATLRNYDRLI